MARAFALLTVVTIVACGGKSAPPPSVTGPQLIVERAAGAPAVAIVVLFPIGSDHDPAGKSGLAHLVEHVYLTAATATTPARSADSLVANLAAGFGSNAQTGARFTVVASLVPRDRLEAELADAAARMTSLAIADGDLAREVPRMQVELANMQHDMPTLAACNRARSRVRPLDGTLPGGVIKEVAAIRADEIADRLRRYYRANNAIVAIVGDVDVAATRAIAERLFAAAPSGEPVPPPREPGPPRVGRDPLALPGPAIACAAWRMPPLTDPRLPTLLALASRLSSGIDGATLQWPLLDEAEVLTAAFPADDLDRRLGEIDRALAAAARRDVRGVPSPFVAEVYASTNPYGRALALVRWRQLGIDITKLQAAVDSVDDRAIVELATQLLAIDRAAIVVTR